MSKDKFNKYIKKIIYDDNSMKENNIYDVINKIKVLFSDNRFVTNLNDARNNWLGLPVNEVLNSIIIFLESLENIFV